MGKAYKMRKNSVKEEIEKKIRVLGSDPNEVETIECVCKKCGLKVYTIICKNGSLGVSFNECCLRVCDQIRKEYGLPGIIENCYYNEGGLRS